MVSPTDLAGPRPSERAFLKINSQAGQLASETNGQRIKELGCILIWTATGLDRAWVGMRRVAPNGAVLTRPGRPQPGFDVTLQPGNWGLMDFSVL